ncbi:MAG: hypothetical protein WBG11_13605 [Methylocella sp.]
MTRKARRKIAAAPKARIALEAPRGRRRWQRRRGDPGTRDREAARQDWPGDGGWFDKPAMSGIF